MHLRSPAHLPLEEIAQFLDILSAYTFHTLHLLAIPENDRRRKLVKRQEILGLGILGDVYRVGFDWIIGLFGSGPAEVVKIGSSRLICISEGTHFSARSSMVPS